MPQKTENYEISFLKDMFQPGKVKNRIVYVLQHCTESIFFGSHTTSFLEHSSLFQNFMEKKGRNIPEHSWCFENDL